jgi:hypothetical protein
MWIIKDVLMQSDAPKTYDYRQLIHVYLKEDGLKVYENKYDKTYDNVKKQLENETKKFENDYCCIQLNLDRDEINFKPSFILKKINCYRNIVLNSLRVFPKL